MRAVTIQTSTESVLSPPLWFGEVALMAAHLLKHSALTQISERVHFARRRFGHYEVIDFLAILFGYAIGGVSYNLVAQFVGNVGGLSACLLTLKAGTTTSLRNSWEM